MNLGIVCPWLYSKSGAYSSKALLFVYPTKFQCEVIMGQNYKFTITPIQ